MDLDILLHHYFGTDDLASLAAARLESGQEQLAVDFSVERDPGRRFALWTLMCVLDFAPDPDEVFETEKERSAARLFAQLTESNS